jgi:hypothetical protein
MPAGAYLFSPSLYAKLRLSPKVGFLTSLEVGINLACKMAQRREMPVIGIESREHHDTV